MKDFRDFIMSQLTLANINKEYRELFTDPEGMELFWISVTHPSYDPVHNYNEFEFIGDGILKGILSQYIPRRFPDLTSTSKKGTGEGILSKTRRLLEQRKTLSDFALKRGFWDYVRADNEVKTKLRKETLEDVYEAFIGVLVTIVDNRIKPGLGYFFANAYAKASLDELHIDLSKEGLDDPITRLNELYKTNDLKGNKPPLKWGDAVYLTKQLEVPKAKPQNAQIGHIYFDTDKRVAQVFDGVKWVHQSKAPQVEWKPYPIEVVYNEAKMPINAQRIWYAGVYGFPKNIGGPPPEKISAQQILDNPNKYGAAIIGQGLMFKKADSRKFAAEQALAYLAARGIERI